MPHIGAISTTPVKVKRPVDAVVMATAPPIDSPMRKNGTCVPTGGSAASSAAAVCMRTSTSVSVTASPVLDSRSARARSASWREWRMGIKTKRSVCYDGRDSKRTSRSRSRVDNNKQY